MEPKSCHPSSTPLVANLSAPSTVSPTPDLSTNSARLGQDFTLLDSRQCLPIGYHLHEFEGAALGTDFRSKGRDFDHWFVSGCLFYAAVCHGPFAPFPPIAALVSAFIATKSSCERFIRASIAEHELEPWSASPSVSEPVIYFSTVICPRRQWLPLLYSSLLQDLLSFAQSQAARFRMGLSIAGTPAGARHLTRNGFVPLEPERYLGRYDFMAITSASAKTAFWRALFDRSIRGQKPSRTGDSRSARRPRNQLAPARGAEGTLRRARH